MNMTLRSATLADLPTINYWNKKPHVIFASGEDDLDEDVWMKEQLINSSEFVIIFVAEKDKRPIGLIQICDPKNEETHYWGKINAGYRAIDIWIGEESDLGKGYGTEIMKLTIEYCFKSQGVHSIIIDPLVKNMRAIKFYEKMGFKFVENRYLDQDYCAVYKLDKTY